MDGIIVLAILFCIMIVLYWIRTSYEEKRKIDASIKVASINDTTERLKIYANFDFDKIDERIDRYIDEAGKMYKMNHFEYKDPEDIYLTEDMMNEMIKSIVKDVNKKITPAVLSLLQLSYNINSDTDLTLFLYNKVKLYVLTYSLEANAEVE
jgi:hypothetical protein